ncbi:MAG: hypothetical protein Q9M37_04145 [Desulfonauticus sp.]|nr:hypothetical protein [Desulfonauticus sp.]
MGEVIEIKVEFKKPLDKMTAKELRELAIEQLPMITGASSMTKDELLAKIKEVLNINDEEGKANTVYKQQIRELKHKLKELRFQRLQASSRAERDRLRKKIHKLKRLTRKLATA